MDIEHVRRKLSDHTPEPVDMDSKGGNPADAQGNTKDAAHEEAAVAVVLREGEESAEVLLIERAVHERDPWSGHMAFPGGRRETHDDSTRMTAARETFEEVGVELTGAEYLGHVDSLVGNRRMTPRLVVSAHAFHLDAHQEFALDPSEVQEAFWFPLAGLHEEARKVEHVLPEMPDVRFPGIVVGRPDRHIVWGLTFRFLDRMLRVLDRPFVEPWGNLEHFEGRFGPPPSR